MPDFKKKASKLAGRAAGKAKTFASFAATKTKHVSRIAKLNVDIASERDTIKRVYREIGKLYYETHREDPETYFVQLCREIDVSMESIASMEAEIVRLKTQGNGESASAEAETEAETETAPEDPGDPPQE